MDYEKSYKDALDRAKKLKETSDSTAVIDGCEQIFPELQGNEDEKMRKWIIDGIRYNMSYNMRNETLLHLAYKKKAEKAIAWLEKQGETNIQNNKPFKIESDKFYFCIKDYFAGGCYRSKNGDVVLAKNGMNMMGLSPKEASEYFMPINPFNKDVVAWFEKQRETSQEETVDIANKIRPKFDIGDWITCPGFISAPHILQVINIGDGLYELEDVYGTKKRSTIGDTESIYDYWTFNDAKEGDVLCYKDFDCIRTFIHKFGNVYYCCLINDVFIPHSDYFVVQDDRLLSYIRPATKEQRDLLFAKMHEAGYEWDKDKKELIKQMTDDEHKQYMLEHQNETIYDMSFEEAQDYISKRGFDIPWNDGDVMVDERCITQTVANVLKWADRHPLILLDNKQEEYASGLIYHPK